MYSLPGCGYCSKARHLLDVVGHPYEEVVGVPTPEFRAQLHQITGRTTAPQILIHGKPIGGFQQLARLESRGVLSARVEGDAFPIARVRRRLSVPRLVRAVLSTVGGGACSAWVYEVELLDENGSSVDRQRVSSQSEAEELAGVLEGAA